MLVDSGAIVDHLDEVYGGDIPLTPRSGPHRRAVLRVNALMMGTCDKGLQAAYSRNHIPPEKQQQPWIDDCLAGLTAVLDAVERTVEVGGKHLLLGRLTGADVCAFVAERLARSLGIDTAARMLGLHRLARGLADMPPFASTEP